MTAFGINLYNKRGGIKMQLSRIMARSVVTLAVGTLLLAGTWRAVAAETKTLEGVVGDTMCGLKHQMGNISDKECTTKCVGMGSSYALIVGDTVYELNGKSGDLEKLAGAKAKVTGSVDG
jgi:hypothetical protein